MSTTISVIWVTADGIAGAQGLRRDTDAVEANGMEILMKKQFGLAILALSLVVPGAFASEKFEVSLGHSQVVGPVQEMATVIVGDNGVADATLGGGGTIILTGKSLGATNLIVLDETGRELLSSSLHVVPLDRRPTKTVRVLTGASNAQNYVCGPTPGCSPVDGNNVASNVAVAGDAEDGATSETPETPEAAPETTPGTDETATQEQVSSNQ